MKVLLRKMWHDDAAQDLVEYSLIAGLLSQVAYLAIKGAGVNINNLWTSINSEVSTAS